MCYFPLNLILPSFTDIIFPTAIWIPDSEPSGLSTLIGYNIFGKRRPTRAEWCLGCVKKKCPAQSYQQSILESVNHFMRVLMQLTKSVLHLSRIYRNPSSSALDFIPIIHEFSYLPKIAVGL